MNRLFAITARMALTTRVLKTSALTTSILMTSALAASVQAAPSAKPATTAAPANTTPAQAAAPVATQSDVIGSKEAPGVFNIVPWKDKPAQIPKKEISTSILRETLQPLDRDVLLREIEFHRSIDQP